LENSVLAVTFKITSTEENLTWKERLHQEWVLVKWLEKIVKWLYRMLKNIVLGCFYLMKNAFRTYETVGIFASELFYLF